MKEFHCYMTPLSLKTQKTSLWIVIHKKLWKRHYFLYFRFEMKLIINQERNKFARINYLLCIVLSHTISCSNHYWISGERLQDEWYVDLSQTHNLYSSSYDLYTPTSLLKSYLQWIWKLFPYISESSVIHIT